MSHFGGMSCSSSSALQSRQDVEDAFDDYSRKPQCQDDNESATNSAAAEGDLTNLGITIKSQELICEFHESLDAENQERFKRQFEEILYSIIEDVQLFRRDSKNLEDTFKNERKNHELRLKQIIEEADHQLNEEIEKTRLHERLLAERERERLRDQLVSEISLLKENFHRLENMYDDLNKERSNESTMRLNLLNQIEALQAENEQLVTSLRETRTELSLSRSEIAELKESNKEKAQISTIRHKSVNSEESERQLTLLRKEVNALNEANQKLNDTNDILRLEIEKKNTADIRIEVNDEEVPSQKIRGFRKVRSKLKSNNTWTNESTISSSDAESDSGFYISRLQSFNSNIAQTIENANDINTPESIAQEMNDIETDFSLRDYTEINRAMYDELMTPTSKHHRQDSISKDDSALDTSKFPSKKKRLTCTLPNTQFSPLGQNSNSVTGSRNFLADFQNEYKTNRSSEPERMFKIVFAGDSAVGKTSFIMRFCKGQFAPTLTSTLGVDFHNKILEIDDRPTALQLWDTCGQERFRSISKSYFRRADGVVLMYDCTMEKSFLNVRDWILSINESNEKQIPIVLIGNKTDLRDEARLNGRKVIERDEGIKLAKTYNALFIETSAKDGSNMDQSLIELCRMMSCNQDLEIKIESIKLGDKVDEKKKTCC